jgi:hypothetical protein
MVNAAYHSNVESITFIFCYNHTYSLVMNRLSHTYFNIQKHINTHIMTRTLDTHTHTQIQAKFQYSVFQCITCHNKDLYITKEIKTYFYIFCHNLTVIAADMISCQSTKWSSLRRKQSGHISGFN